VSAPREVIDHAEVKSMATLLETWADMPSWQGRGFSLPNDLREAARYLRAMKENEIARNVTHEAEVSALREQLAAAVKLLREIDKHGVLSMATQRGAGEFVRAIDAANGEAATRGIVEVN